MHLADPDIVDCLLSNLGDFVIDLFGGFFDYFLDAPRMDTTVSDQFIHGQPRNFSANGIEARNYDCVRRVIDYHIHTGSRLEGSDVATFAPDYTSLHLVAW